MKPINLKLQAVCVQSPVNSVPELWQFSAHTLRMTRNGSLCARLGIVIKSLLQYLESNNEPDPINAPASFILIQVTLH